MNFKTLLMTVVVMATVAFTGCKNKSEEIAEKLPGTYSFSITESTEQNGGQENDILDGVYDFKKDGTYSSDGTLTAQFFIQGTLAATLSFHVEESGTWKTRDEKIILTTTDCKFIPGSVKSDYPEIYEQYSRMMPDVAYTLQSKSLSDPTEELDIISFEDDVLTVEFKSKETGKSKTIKLVKK